MAVEQGSSKTLFKVALFFLIVLVVLSISIYFLQKFRPSEAKPLASGSFTSQVEQRSYIDKDGKKIIYYVINTTNKTTTDYYDCQFDIVAKGTENIYHAFLSDFVLRDCNQAGLEVKPNYECRLDNGVKKYFRYEPAISLRKFSKSTSHEIAVSRFYETQSKAAEGFYAKNQLSDIFEYHIFCKTPAGTKVSHSQPM